MKLDIFIRILQLACLMLMLFSLYFHNDFMLIIAAFIMAVCIVLSFAAQKKK